MFSIKEYVYRLSKVQVLLNNETVVKNNGTVIKYDDTEEVYLTALYQIGLLISRKDATGNTREFQKNGVILCQSHIFPY